MLFKIEKEFKFVDKSILSILIHSSVIVCALPSAAGIA
jgi:hypothetical protein